MKKIIIYGAGHLGRRCLTWLGYCEISQWVIAFCDRNAATINAIEDIPVLKYDELRNNDAVWLVTPAESKDIVDDLKADGIEFFVLFSEFVYKYCSDNYRALGLVSDHQIRVDEYCLELRKAYSEANNHIVDYNIEARLNDCYVFFSGNGIYRENTVGELNRTLFAEDRYEWEYLFGLSGLDKRTGKSIFVRDIYKNFYVTGISERYSDVDKLLAFLEKETKGYNVITVGNSAGAYMALLAGSVLRAQSVISFSGIVNLYQYNNSVYGDNYYFMKKYREDAGRNQYFDIVERTRGICSILYFYASRNEEDIRQAKLISDIPNYYIFPIVSEIHGTTIRNDQIAKLLSCDPIERIKRIKKYRNIETNIDDFVI